MGIPDQIVVLLVIIGAAAFVTMGFAFQRLFGGQDPNEGKFNVKLPEQEAYMREVRSRNMMQLFGEVRPSHRHPREI
ncbi:hypothetical protein FOPE_10062 [Fonsecaea pedrosoi]|nr:hypothetical protein FOPE_10062 [Fonsecaea pedrosoi]